MTDAHHVTLLWAAVLSPLVAGAIASLVRAPRVIGLLGLCAGTIGLAAGITSIVAPVTASGWLMGDRAAGIYLCVVAVVCAMSVLVSPAYLARTPGTFVSATRSGGLYWLALFGFWSTLVCIPAVANLGIAWLVVEASTAASAVLVAHSGKARALEAGWKYLMLTTLGLSASFLGIVLLFLSPSATGGLRALDWRTLGTTMSMMPGSAATVAYALVMVGLAAKIGWAPIHNWLPDAHSEAPAPVSAMLSAVLLPVVALLAWRLRDAAVPSIGTTAANAPLIVFGLCSVALAIPFLWQPLAWKRLLAYSSMEHMGIIALGIAFASPLAIAGVVIHVVGHAIAKSLGFYASISLYDVDPNAARHRAAGVVDVAPGTAAAMVVSASTLAGLPPGPLFVSEVLIILGGLQSGHIVLAAVLAVLAALAFLGVLDALLAIVGHGHAHGPARGEDVVVERTGWIFTAVAVAAASLVAVAIAGWLLADSQFVIDLARGIA